MPLPSEPPTPGGRRHPFGPAFAAAIGLHALALLLVVRAPPVLPSLASQPLDEREADLTIELFDEPPAASPPGVGPALEAAAALSNEGAREREALPGGARGLTLRSSEVAARTTDAIKRAAPTPEAPRSSAGSESVVQGAPGGGEARAGGEALAGVAAGEAPRALNFSLTPGALGGAEQARPGPLASTSTAERNLKQAFADDSVPFGVRDPLLYAGRVAMNAPDVPNVGQAFLALSFDERGVVREVTLLSATNESEGWGRVRDAFAAALRNRKLAAGGRGGRATIALGAAMLPVDEPGVKKPKETGPQYVPREQNIGPDEPEYKGESGSVTPYKGPILTPGKVVFGVREAIAAAQGKRSAPPVFRTAYTRVVRFARD